MQTKRKLNMNWLNPWKIFKKMMQLFQIKNKLQVPGGNRLKWKLNEGTEENNHETEKEVKKLKRSKIYGWNGRQTKKVQHMNNCSSRRSKQNVVFELVFKFIIQDNFLEVKENFSINLEQTYHTILNIDMRQLSPRRILVKLLEFKAKERNH